MENVATQGLFWGTETGSTVQNLRLKESYFSISERSIYKLGSIVADCHRNLDNVYSDTFDVTLADATNMGIGNYVHTIENTTLTSIRFILKHCRKKALKNMQATQMCQQKTKVLWMGNGHQRNQSVFGYALAPHFDGRADSSVSLLYRTKILF